LARLERDGTLHRSGLSVVQARRDEALPEGGALLHGEVRNREAQPAARPAWQAAQGEAGGLRPAAPREAEGQAHLRGAGEPVPALLRDGGPSAGHHGRNAAPAPRAPVRQRDLPPRSGDLARAGATAGATRTL